MRSSVDDYDENVSTEQAEQAQESVELPANSDTMTQEPVRTSCGRIVKEVSGLCKTLMHTYCTTYTHRLYF